MTAPRGVWWARNGKSFPEVVRERERERDEIVDRVLQRRKLKARAASLQRNTEARDSELLLSRLRAQLMARLMRLR